MDYGFSDQLATLMDRTRTAIVVLLLPALIGIITVLTGLVLGIMWLWRHVHFS